MQVMLSMQQKQNRMTPLSKPAGLDPLLLLSERENRVASRMTQRISELEDMSATMSDDLQVQAMIELRALRLINFQRQQNAAQEQVVFIRIVRDYGADTKREWQ